MEELTYSDLVLKILISGSWAGDSATHWEAMQAAEWLPGWRWGSLSGLATWRRILSQILCAGSVMSTGLCVSSPVISSQPGGCRLRKHASLVRRRYEDHGIIQFEDENNLLQNSQADGRPGQKDKSEGKKSIITIQMKARTMKRMRIQHAMTWKKSQPGFSWPQAKGIKSLIW